MLNRLKMLYDKKCINCEYFTWYDDGHMNGVFCYDTECRFDDMRMCFNENTNTCTYFKYEKIPGANRQELDKMKNYYWRMYCNDK